LQLQLIINNLEEAQMRTFLNFPAHHPLTNLAVYSKVISEFDKKNICCSKIQLIYKKHKGNVSQLSFPPSSQALAGMPQ